MDLLIQTAPAGDRKQRIVGPLNGIVRRQLSAYSEIFWQKGIRLVDEVPAQRLWVLARPDKLRKTIDELFVGVCAKARLYDVVIVRLTRQGPLVRLEIAREPAREIGQSVAASTEWFEAPALWSEAA